MICVIIGQRGSGKTHFLRRIENYHIGKTYSIKCIDLDAYIEQCCRMNINDIFQKKGEIYFRTIEKRYFFEILKKMRFERGHCYISVGGGFNCSVIPRSVRILWLRRVSDQWGRIFIDRPRLNLELSPIEEFQQRAKARVQDFTRFAWEEYLLPEGLRESDKIEKSIILSSIKNLNCGLTILPHIFINSKAFRYFLKKRLNWGLKFFEFRDDLLSVDQFDKVTKLIQKEQMLFSLRSGQMSSTELNEIKNRVQWIDCDQTLVEKYSLDDITIVSRHHRNENDKLEDILFELKAFENGIRHIKLAVLINNFQELKLGHEWFLADSKNRSFLPRSCDGRWQWYRLMMNGQMFVEFFREGEGSAADQPTLYQWLHARSLTNSGRFAALLGSPVKHSFTPIEQSLFFAKKNMQILSIDIAEKDFIFAVKMLQELGLRAAAVTSPLKQLAYQVVDEKTAEAAEFESVNTLLLQKNNKSWLGTNTDFEGLKELLKDLPQYNIAIWGGGGTLPLLQKILPDAFCFSSQSASLRKDQSSAENFNPEYVIWAAPRADGKNVLNPPLSWRPKKVIDLNYREDSGGRDYAMASKAIYISGEAMFYTQAHHQRLFWEKNI